MILVSLSLIYDLVTILEGGECVWGYTTERGGIHRAWRVSPTREVDPNTRGRIPHTLELYESIGITL